MVEFTARAWGYDRNDPSIKELYEELAKKGEEVQKALREAMDFATKHGLTFYFSPCYGMGGEFVGKAEDRSDNYRADGSGWEPSSGSC